MSIGRRGGRPVTTIHEISLSVDWVEFRDSRGAALGHFAPQDVVPRFPDRVLRLVSRPPPCRRFPVKSRGGEQVEVGGVVFHPGKHADLLASARSVLLAVVSLGTALEDTSRDLQSSEYAFSVFMLDQVCVCSRKACSAGTLDCGEGRCCTRLSCQRRACPGAALGMGNR